MKLSWDGGYEYYGIFNRRELRISLLGWCIAIYATSQWNFFIALTPPDHKVLCSLLNPKSQKLIGQKLTIYLIAQIELKILSNEPGL